VIVRVWNCIAPEHYERCTAEKPGHNDAIAPKRRQNLFFCGWTETAIRCDSPGCTAETKIGHFGMIKASSKDGWFFRKDSEDAFCFDHLPDWVISWRDRRNPGWRDNLRKDIHNKVDRIAPVG
jgi:hypothetical protein